MLIALSTMLVLAAAPAAEERLLLHDLTAEGVEAPVAQALTTAACFELSALKSFDLMCPDDIRALMQWNAMASTFSACQDQACLESSAKALDAKLVASGSVQKAGESYVLSLSLLDTRAGKVRARAEVKAASIDALHKQVAEAVSQLFPKKK
ncbi:MAG: hypothetical protein U1E65_12860 [Myxococcota bacterium]